MTLAGGFRREHVPYLLRLSGFDFEAGSDPQPLVSDKGGPVVDRRTGWPTYVVEVLVHVRGEARSVKVPVMFAAPEAPGFGWRQPLVLDGLELVVRAGLVNGRPFVREEFYGHNLRPLEMARPVAVAA